MRHATPRPAVYYGWLTHGAPLLLPAASTCCLDCHPIPSRGDPTGRDARSITQRGHAGPRALALFAHEPDHRVFCYAHANLPRAEPPGALMPFVEFWQASTGYESRAVKWDILIHPTSA